MNGQLHEHPLAELIREISAAGLSGALRLEHERVKTVLYFDAGELIYATSNLRAHRLAECLRRWGAVTEQQLAEAGETEPDMKLVGGLFSTGALSRQALEDLLARQAIEVLRPVLLWTAGQWIFDPRVRLAKDVRVRVETGKLLLESARRLPGEFVAGRFADHQETLSPAPVDASGFELLPTEAFALSRVTGPTSIHEMTAISGLSEEDTLRAVYTLSLVGLLGRSNWPQAFTEEAQARAQAGKPAPAKNSSPRAATTGLWSKAKSEAGTPVPERKEVADERQELDALFARLNFANDHYEVLGISPDAEAHEIKKTYYTLARRFHPDKFHNDADLRARVESAFAKIAQSYETLKDKTLRAAYDSKLAAKRKSKPVMTFSQPKQAGQGKSADTAVTKDQSTSNAAPQPTAAPPSSKAEELFQQGLAALQQDDQKLAVACLGEAARLAPQQARYRAYYGRALGAFEKTRRLAEAEIQAAISLDAGNVSYRIMLAELYRLLGLARRAQGELERALAIDPKNDAVRRALDSMKKG